MAETKPSGEPARHEAVQSDLPQRLLALVAASGSLLGSPRVQDVLPATLRLAGDLVAADAHAVWRYDLEQKSWAIASALGVSESFTAEILPSHGTASTASSFDPIVAEDVMSMPMLDARRHAYRREGIRSMLAIPLPIDGAGTGSLVFYYRTPHRFSTDEIDTARALGNLAAAAIRTAELYDEQRRLQEQASFLSRAGQALASSLDYSETLKTLASLAVPDIADWCAIDVVHDEGRLDRLAVAHADPARVELAIAFHARYPPDRDDAFGVPHVVRTGKPVLAHVTDDMLVAGARDPDHLAALRALGIASYMMVPLRTRHGVIGVITFVAADSGRRFRDADLRFASTVADRAAIAVENARAYHEAQRANRLKDEFLATLSHELRTPLNAILGYTRMLRQGVVADERRGRALETVERNATSLAQIVEDVLDVSRIVAGKLRLAFQPVYLPTVLDDAIATLLPVAEAKGVRLQADIEAHGEHISGDADRLQQVLWNVLANAVKFTPPGGKVDVRLRRLASVIEIAVTDTGRGIPQDFLPYVFDRFRQADTRAAREHGGLGLGLSIARHIVEMHGGTIGAESAGDGQGASFRMALPIADAGQRPLQSTLFPIAAHAAARAPVKLDGLRVLVVDDDPAALELIRASLEDAGALVTTCSTAAKAEEQLAREKPDVLLSDLAMPGMDGFELIGRIRASKDRALRALPAAAVSAYVRSEDREKALEAGFHRHLPKPVDPADLIAAVAALGRKASTEPA
jgi:signal transduction histidine kinase/ActR/RegA family two-component response regulator